MSQRRSKDWSRRPRLAARGAAVAVYALCLVFAAAGGALWLKSGRLTVKTDPATLCPTDRPVTDVMVLLLDMSDALGDAQLAQLRNNLTRLQAQIPRFGVIDVYSLDRGTARLIRPVLELCNPGDGTDMNEWYENPALAKRRWQNDFANKLSSELTRLLEAPPAQTSPILESIQAIAVRTFGLPKYDSAKKQLFLVSDLMQNVPGRMSHYSVITPFDGFKGTTYYNDVRADLREVDVTVFYVVRSQGPQKWPEHRLFWEQYFRDQGATVQRIEPLFGAK
jgi:hypothetical protein